MSLLNFDTRTNYILSKQKKNNCDSNTNRKRMISDNNNIERQQ